MKKNNLKNKENNNSNKKNEVINISSCFEVFYKFNTFKDKNIPKLGLSLISLVFLILIGIITILGNHIENYQVVTDTSLIFGLIFLFLFGSIFLYGGFYVFLKAFDSSNSKKYFESLVVTIFFTTPVIFIGNILNYLGRLTSSLTITYFIVFVLICLFIYYVVLFILTLKNYFKTSGFKIVASAILIYLFILIIFMPFYLTTLLM